MSRNRKRNKRRRRNRRRFSALFKLLAVLAVLAALTIGATVFFQVEHVVVDGNNRYTAQEVEAASGIQVGDNLFRLNKYQIKENIRLSLPYVEEPEVRRLPPSTVVITVKEWSAAAQVEPTPIPRETGAGEDGEDTGKETPEEELVAKDPWLISVGGRLLEPAPENSAAIRVRGLSALSPRAGTQLAVPQAQAEKLENLIALLRALEDQGMLSQISTLDLSGSSQILMQYDQRFTVKLSMGADFQYKLRALADVAAKRENYETGTFDLTRSDVTAIFSPD